MSEEPTKAQPAAQAGSPGEAAAVGWEVGGVHSNDDLNGLDLWALNPQTRACLKSVRRDAAYPHAQPRSEGAGNGSPEITTPQKLRKLQRALYRKAKAQPGMALPNVVRRSGSESRIREIRPSGLMRGRSLTVIGASLSSRRAPAYSTGGAKKGPPNQISARLYTSFQGSRYGRVSSFVASASPMISSFRASHLILRPTSIEIRPRWPGIAE